MKFTATDIPGCYVLDPEPHVDERGFFTRTWCAEELRRQGLNTCVSQCSVSFNKTCGTLRGMHLQIAPHEESKVVRCTRGAVFDIALDLRPGSPAYLRWIGYELTPENGRALYIPEGCAHGFQTLADDSEVHYMISVPFARDSGRTFRWNDPAFNIRWPMPEVVHISQRDATAPYFDLHTYPKP